MTDDVKWINEFLFVVTKDLGKEIDFLKLWGKLALYGDLYGYRGDPAQAIGLAAKKVGLTIRHDVMEGLDFFDDRIERLRISKGQSDREAKREYFEVQSKIENPHRTTFQKIFDKGEGLSAEFTFAVYTPRPPPLLLLFRGHAI